MYRIETIPLVLGVLVGLIGLAILADAWLPEDLPFRTERRRRARTERSTGGEAAIGIGVMCMAAALIGRDTWSYGTVAVIVGTVLFVIGAFLNRSFLRDRITNRGALRRGATRQDQTRAERPNAERPPQPKDRIR